MIIDAESDICRSDGKISTELDGETVILDMESGVYLGLDEIGTQIWGALEKRISVAELVERLRSDYDVSASQCLTDIVPFLNDLAERKLIVIHGH
jgi:hypothetical protein